MSRAEKAALKAYPAERGHLHDRPFLRDGFIHGYEQAEKDLELTWEDMDRIITASNIVADLHYSKKREMTSWKQYCEEVLKRFKEAKK